MMRAGFLVFVHPGTLLVCLALLVLFAGIAHGLTRCVPFRERRELVPLCLAVSALLGGMAVGVEQVQRAGGQAHRHALPGARSQDQTGERLQLMASSMHQQLRNRFWPCWLSALYTSTVKT